MSGCSKILEKEFLNNVCKNIVLEANKIPNGCVKKCFRHVNNDSLLEVLGKMIIQLCTYGFADYYATGDPQLLQNQIAFDSKLISKHMQTPNKGGRCKYTMDALKNDKLDFYLIRKAHLMFMTRTGSTVGYQEVHNLADITCNVLLDMGIVRSNVNLLRYRMSRINIMQISGYFEVDAVKYKRDGVSHLIDGDYCMNLLEKDGEFKQLEQIPRNPSPKISRAVNLSEIAEIDRLKRLKNEESVDSLKKVDD